MRPVRGLHGLDHVQDEGVVALGARRQAAAEAAERSASAPSKPHLSSAEGRVGHDDVEVLEAVVPSSSLGLRMVSPHSMRWLSIAVQEHVHLGQRPGAADGLLAEERVLARAGRWRIRRPHFISSEPEPQVGSQISSPCLRVHQPAISADTSGGV
jgi:hypothetical protein